MTVYTDQDSLHEGCFPGGGGGGVLGYISDGDVRMR